MKVFLSYAAADRQPAQILAEALRETGYDVYPAAHWPEDVHQALKRADAFVVLLSESAEGSPFVNEELKQALVSEHLANRLIPVVLDPSASVPWILRTMQPVPATPDLQTAAAAISSRLGNPRSGRSKRR